MHTYLKISSTTCGEEPLRFIEIKIGFHKKNNKRYIEKLPDLSVFNNILIVDDALDTGYSIKSLIERIGNYNEKNIKIAVINHSDTRSIIKPHYHIYSNKIVQFPWSTDSKFYNQYFSFKKAILDMETKEVYEK
ncbi:phosphoribosyltransferase [Geobacillus sp. FSL K6-0789]|uniref:phosphoribosyltransferase n=1 Tax=Geobacillus sp. FSL K6-0789 TaxID=2954744 RepID=UPI0031585BFC